MGNIKAKQWSRGWKGLGLWGDGLSEIPQAYVVWWQWWKSFSCSLSAWVPSSANEDDSLTCHADLDWATVKTLTSEFYKATDDASCLHNTFRSAGGCVPYHAYSRTPTRNCNHFREYRQSHCRGERAREGCLQQERSPRRDWHHFPSWITGQRQPKADSATLPRAQEGPISRDKAPMVTRVITPLCVLRVISHKLLGAGTWS